MCAYVIQCTTPEISPRVQLVISPDSYIPVTLIEQFSFPFLSDYPELPPVSEGEYIRPVLVY